MKLYINPHTHTLKPEWVKWEGHLKAFPEFEPYERYYVEIPMLVSSETMEESLSNLSVYFTNDREHKLNFRAIPKRGYGSDIGCIRIYEEDQDKPTNISEGELSNKYEFYTFAELTDGVLDSKEKYFHGA